MSQPLSPDEIALFQALVRPAIVLLMMTRLDRPCGARELADLLGLNEHTVARRCARRGLGSRSAAGCARCRV